MSRADLAQAAGASRPRRGDASPPCFASAGRFEVMVDGQKLIGSAQRRLAGAVLQHGSLLIDDTHVGIAGLLRRPDGARRDDVRKMLAEKTTNLESILAEEDFFQGSRRFHRSGFEREWSVNLDPGCLSEGEERTAAGLATEYAI